MNAAEIAAYVGAAAWAPQIAKWLYHVFARPRVRIVPDPFPSLGFTSMGPVFNLNIAAATERKDALIDEVSVTLTHESGEKHRLMWSGHSEGFQIRGSDATVQQVVQRELPPIAIKVITAGLVDKFVRFQDSNFWSQQGPALNAVVEHDSHLRKTAPPHHDEMMRSSQLAALMRVYDEAFWWRPGTYRVSFAIRSFNGATLIPNEYVFTATHNDVEALRANLNAVRVEMENRVRVDEPGYTARRVEWNWRNVLMTRAS